MCRLCVTLLLLVLAAARGGLADETAGGAHWKLATTIDAIALAQSADVQKELKLPARQAKKLQPLVDQWRSRYSAFRKANKRASAEAWQAEYRDLAAEAKAILTLEQLGRLRQIHFQCEGVAAVVVNHEETVKLFGLSPQQRQKLVELQITRDKKRADDFTKRMAANKNPLELFQGGRAAELETLQETNKQALAALEPAQREAWERLIGRPFKGRLVDAKGKPLHPRLDAL